MAIKQFLSNSGIILTYDDQYYVFNPYNSQYKTENDDPSWDIVRKSNSSQIVAGYNGIGIIFHDLSGFVTGSALGLPRVTLPNT